MGARCAHPARTITSRSATGIQTSRASRTMSPADLSVTDRWNALRAQWADTARQWDAWWVPSTGGLPAPEVQPSSAVPARWAFDPEAVATLVREYVPRFQALWMRALAQRPEQGADAQAALMPARTSDRRFAAPEWTSEPYFAFLKDAYLLYGEYLASLAALAQLPPAEKARLQFVTRQYIDAIAPSNFPATNPDVLRRAIETDGQSLVRGFTNLLADARRGRITMSDESAFEIGRNIAATPGSVVFRNELIELLQYDATTPTVHRRPLVIVPPCINKYYILDLRPENSFVRNAVAQGHTVFMVSWRNIPVDLARFTWDDYLEQGVMTALSTAREIAGSKTADALGFCVGGTLLACALAVLAARGDRSIASATFLTTMLDFADPGEIGVYISPESLAAREGALLSGQCVPGSELAGAFASLRANDLVWNYVVGNYLKGETPPAFDLLYWNGDSTNLPGPMYAYYLQNLYVENQLRNPDALTMAGARVDLGGITMPVYVYASREDHIVPWRSGYRTTSLVGGEPTFVLGASGHIAGVVNPPVPPRRNYWVNPRIFPDPDTWLANATSVAGSWWPHWYTWLESHGGRRRRAPETTGNPRHPPLEPAPGSYVRAEAGC